MRVKTYIGNGKQVADMDIVEVTINMEDATPFIFEYEGKKYLKFAVAKRQEVSEYGKTHTVSVSTLVKEEAAEEVSEPAVELEKPKRSRKK